MCKHHAKPLPPLVLGLILLGSACAVDETAGVDAQQLGGVWVFTYSETPTMSMDALGGGPASVVDDCLLLDDAVVIWHDDQLDTVEDVIEQEQRCLSRLLLHHFELGQFQGQYRGLLLAL